jgi:hypothetical protein
MEFRGCTGFDWVMVVFWLWGCCWQFFRLLRMAVAVVMPMGLFIIARIAPPHPDRPVILGDPGSAMHLAGLMCPNFGSAK